jgi:hypothetical protein
MAMSPSFTNEAFHKIQENWTVFLGITVLVYALNEFVIYPFYTSPLAKVPWSKVVRSDELVDNVAPFHGKTHQDLA